MKKRILIITQDFPPNRSQVGWMIRMTEFANHLARNDYEVFVLTCERYLKWENLVDVNKKIRVTRVKGFASYWDIPKSECDTKSLIFKALTRGIYNIFKRRYVDLGHMDLNKYMAAASKLIDEYSIQNVIISVPPHSMGIIGKAIKDKYKDRINYILDYRDSWSLRDSFTKSLSANQYEIIKQKEQASIDSADKTVFVSSGMLDEYNKLFRIKNSIVAENGFIEYENSRRDEEFDEKTRKYKENNAFLIGYFGSGSLNGNMPNKDMSKFVSYIDEWKSLSEPGFSNVMLVLQGQFPGAEKFEGISPDISGVLIFKPASNDRARNNMSLTDICLFYLNDIKEAPHIMGGKLYDYVASGVPIWLVVSKRATSLVKFASENRNVFVSDVDNKDDIKKTLSEMLELWRENKLKNYGFTTEESKKYIRSNQYEIIETLFE